MKNKQFENISTSIAELMRCVRENDMSELEEEIFYNKILAAKEAIEFKRG